MSLRLDFTTKSIIKDSNEVQNHVFMDIGTSNFELNADPITNNLIINDLNTTHFDKAAIKNSLNNILNFRMR